MTTRLIAKKWSDGSLIGCEVLHGNSRATVEEIVGSIDGAVRLDRSIEGSRAWNIAELRLRRKKRIDKHDKPSRVLYIRVTPGERMLVKQAADEAGMSVSDFVRRTLVDEAGLDNSKVPD